MPSIHDDSTPFARGATPASKYCPACAASFSSTSDACPRDGTQLIRWDPLGDTLIGETLDGRYRVLDCFAVGDASILYRGVQLAIDRPIAIKVLRLVDEPVVTRRFLREAQILKALNHPNIVSIFDVGHTAAGDLYVVLELLRGKTLDAELARVGRLDVQRTCEITIQLCHALTAAHARGIVHRDLSPANIMLLEDEAVLDLVKVVDFGLARPTELVADEAVLTAAGSIVGTPRYIAPEALFSRGTADPRSDLYSLGCVMRDMLAGRTARFDFAVQREDATTLPADVPRPVAEIALALLAQAPEHRPPATTVATRLQAWLDEEQTRLAAAEAETLVVGAAVSAAERPTLIAVAPPVHAPREVFRVLPPTPLIAQPIPRIAPPAPRVTQAIAPVAEHAATVAQPALVRRTSLTPRMVLVDARWMLGAALLLVALGVVILIGIVWP